MRHRNNVDRLLAESFKELACTTPIDKITIKEITDKAGVIRPTFYNHFQDKYEPGNSSKKFSILSSTERPAAKSPRKKD